MAKEFKLPDLGEGITSADVIRVAVNVGDRIEKGQTIVEIETDKAAAEVPSDFSGIVTEVRIQTGQKASPGQIIALIEEAADNIPVAPSVAVAAKANVAASATLIDFKLPDLGEGVKSVDVIRIAVNVGDRVESGQTIIEVETDKAAAEVPSTIAGIVTEVLVSAGQKIGPGQVVLRLATSTPITAKVEAKPAVASAAPAAPAKLAVSPPAAAVQAVRSMPEVAKKLVPAAPTTRRFAREIGVDITAVPGSGPGGRISIDDIKRFARQQKSASASTTGPGIPVKGLPDFGKWGEIRRDTMSNVRRKTAENLGYAGLVIPPVTQHDKADITELEKLRKQYSPRVEKAGGKLTITAILLKVIAGALKQFPQFNASLDMDKSEIVYKNYYNIGVAVDTERGLLVPVVRDVDKKNVTQLAADMNEIAKKAREKKLTMDDMQGGCFTISNLGGLGGTAFTPIVNWPEVAILGVSRSAMEPVWIDDAFQPRLMMPLSLTYDHRLIDGADAVRFQRWIIEALEHPFFMMLEG